jgi:NADP-dependent 3-hydroxy acid dehydrogenase YdfG
MKKIVLVTGASSGIGFEIASYLSERGCKVYGGSRTAPKSEKFTAVKLDVTDEKNVTEVVNDIIKKEKRNDVLINNT